jgi:hypothetical protein
MPKIPLYQRQVRATGQSQPRMSPQAASAPWQAAGQAGQAISQVGGVLADYQQKKNYDEKIKRDRAEKLKADFENKLSAEKDKADVANVRNTLDNNWTSAKDIMAEMSDQKEISEFYNSWMEEQNKFVSESEISETAAPMVQAYFSDIKQQSNNAVNGARGYVKSAEIKNIDSVWVVQEQKALNDGNEDAYVEALGRRLEIGMIDQEYYSKNVRKFGQEVYYRKAYKGLDINYDDTVKSVNPDKMSAEQFGIYSQHKAEVENKIAYKTEQVRDSSFSKSVAEANRNELTLSQIVKLANEKTNVYAGVSVSPLSKDQINSLKATVMGGVSADKGTLDYKLVMETISDNLEKGQITEDGMNAVLMTLSKNGKAKFTTETNKQLLNQISDLFYVGMKFDPAWNKSAFKTSKIHGDAIKSVVDAYDRNVDIMLADDDVAFKALQGRISSLMDLFSEKGSKITRQDVLDWRKSEMGDIDFQNAETAQRNVAVREIAQEQEDGRVAVFDADTKEFIRWQ